MIVPTALHQSKRATEHLPEAQSIVAGDRQSAATFWTVQRKRADDDVPARSDGFSDAFGIHRPVPRISQKMKRGAIVPNIISLGRLPHRHISDYPIDRRAALAKPCL